MDPADAMADASGLLAARWQMALTLGWHIVVACLGVGFPVLLLVAEGLWLRTGDPVWRALARRWSKAFVVLFAVGAVSGTVLSFELGLLWPKFMSDYGAVIGLPFTLETFAFFLEAIFAGIYLYTWDRLPARAHWLTGFPVALAGLASAWFVVTANAWMNAPQGFRWAWGRVVDADPWAAMMNPATPLQTAHMIVAAYLVSGFAVASVYAASRLRGVDTAYHRRAMALGLAMGVLSAPAQVVVGDGIARMVARTQPVKFAAMEGQFATESRAPLRIGGIPDEEAGRTRFAIEVPGVLSWLAHGDAGATVRGLKEFSPDDRPPLAVVHVAFQIMVLGGLALLALSLWAAGSLLVRRRLPEGRTFLVGTVAAGPLAALALEAGWVVTEVGRQPWIVFGHMRTAEAVTPSPGIGWALAAVVTIYAVLTAGTIGALRYLARIPIPESAREP